MNKNEQLLSFVRMVHHLQNAEHQEYVSYLMNLEALVLSIGDPELTALWNKFKNYGIFEDFLYNHPRSAEETGLITGLNTKRVTTFSYILTFIDNVIKRSPHDDDVQKAKHLDFVAEPYKKAVNKDIPAKTADFRNFIQDYRLEPNATYVEDFNLTKTVNALEAENKELELNYDLRAQLWLEKEKHGTLTQLRPIEDEAMQAVADTLLFLYRANERGAKNDALQAKFEAIFSRWNAYTEQFERALAHRGVKVSHDKPTPDYPTPPENPQPPSPPVPPPPFGE